MSHVNSGSFTFWELQSGYENVPTFKKTVGLRLPSGAAPPDSAGGFAPYPTAWEFVPEHPAPQSTKQSRKTDYENYSRDRLD